MERWLPVVGYEGIYEVSNRGRVKSLARMMGNEPGKRARETSRENEQGRVKSLARMMGNEPGKRARETSRENEQEKSTGRLSTRSTDETSH
jgi:hypothetical protein